MEQTQVFNDIRETLRRLEVRMDGLDRKVDHSVDVLRKQGASDFRWLVGLQITTLVTLVAALIGVMATR